MIIQASLLMEIDPFENDFGIDLHVEMYSIMLRNVLHNEYQIFDENKLITNLKEASEHIRLTIFYDRSIKLTIKVEDTLSDLIIASRTEPYNFSYLDISINPITPYRIKTSLDGKTAFDSAFYIRILLKLTENLAIYSLRATDFPQIALQQ